MRHRDYAEPAPFRFRPLTRTGIRNVGTWWRTRDGHFLLMPMSASWALNGRDDAQQAWLESVGLTSKATNSFGWPGGPFFGTIPDALGALAVELHTRPPAEPFPSYPGPVRFGPANNAGLRVSDDGHWQLDGEFMGRGSWWLAARSEQAKAWVTAVYGDLLRLPHHTVRDAAVCAARMAGERTGR